MRFDSEAERMEHPQARLIPLDVWWLFGNELSDFQLALMQAPTSELGVYLESLDRGVLQSLGTTKEKITTWLALVCSHPDVADAELIVYASRLGLSTKDIFVCSAILGHLNFVDKLIETNPSQLQMLIEAGSYKAFREAAGHGHLAVMERLMELAPNNVQAMISAGDYDAFREAAGHGHLVVMERLIDKLKELAPANVQAMISRWGYGAFREAAGHGHLAVMERLMELTPNNVQAMISAGDYKAFRAAAREGHFPVVNRLLQFSSVFAYAEMHEREYGAQCVHPFVHAKLSALQEICTALEANNPRAVFDIIDPEEAKLCFYILRNLIRRNDPALLDDIRFLIEIPSVKALLHTAVTPNQPNELFRLALSLGNQDAAEILLTVPAVAELARNHDFYRLEARGGLDLEALARDHESSMTALTSGEQKRLEAALKVYHPVIEQRGAPALIQTLREQLKTRYQEQPARVRTGDGRELDLPFDWNDWQVLSTTLSADTREQALQAYYQHQDHTVFRYLSKPNLWMAVDAPYVNHDHTGGWSTFEEYQPLIAMFYLGALDENAPPCDGHTLDTRLEHFIDELAHIGRAHNWDSSRINAQGVLEEYDDLRGDKPSCYSGVKRRLFQSVLGHRLLKILTMDDIKQELREYVREHFKQSILEYPAKAVEWKIDWDTVCETGMGGEKLAEMNIPEDAQTALIEALREKYPYQFDEDPSFQTYIQDRFKLNEPVTTHAARFGGEVDLTALLELCVAKEAVSREALRALRLNNSIYAQPNSRGEDESSEQAPDEGRQPKV